MMRKFILAFICLFLTVPATLAASPYPNISAWIPSWDFEKGSKTVLNNTDIFTEVSPFWYYLNTDGSIGLAAGAGNKDFVTQVHQAGIRVFPSITNSFDNDKASAVMADENKRKDFVANVMTLIHNNGYDGIDIDFEGMKLPNKDNFVLLLQLLASTLHAENKFLTVAIQAKTSDPGPWETLQAQDWPKIADAVDRFRIMAYDEHYSGSEAGSIASVPWIKSILDFAKTQVPENKLILGMPMYGYSWGEKKASYSVTFDDIEYLLKKYKPAIQFDEVTKEPFIEYNQADPGSTETDNRKTYFQNKDSISNKWGVAQGYPVAGAIFWRLGGEDLSVWQYFREQKKAVLKTGEFGDVNKDHWAYKYIQALRGRGLSQGLNNQFFPEKGLTRVEGLKIVLTAGRIPATHYPVTARFADIKAGEWFEPFVQTAKARGIVSGSGNNFYPFQNLTRSEAVKIIERSGGKGVANIARPNDVITRAEFAKLVAVGFRLVSN